MSDDQGLTDAWRNLVGVRADLFVDPNHGRVRIDTHLETGGHHEMVIVHEGVDVVHVAHALDDGLERFGGELDGVSCANARCLHHDVDHGDTDLRLFFAGDCGDRQDPDGERGDEKQGREGRLQPERRERPGYPKLHLRAPGPRMTSPGARPARISV